jgi:hypothetical protein
MCQCHREVAAGILVALILCVTLAGCGSKPEAAKTEASRSDYGVFLSVTENLDSLKNYDTVVIDAQYFSKEEIDAFRTQGHRVYTYLNIGSLENFREYYSEYEDLTLGAYEHWEEERWINVSDSRWQEFLTEELVPALLAKGVDGFLVDNCDVYYVYPRDEIRDGLTAILQALMGTGKAVIINGGDTYLDAYCETDGQWSDVIAGINQESVFSTILWDDGTFGTAEPEDREYFQDYVERYAAQGAEIYLLEYTKDESLINEIREYCEKKGFHYYIASSLELNHEF